MMRQAWIDKDATATVALTRQCVLAGVSRATVYARQRPRLLDQHDEMLKRLIDQEYTRHPFYGTRRMVVYLGQCGHTVNRSRSTGITGHDHRNTPGSRCLTGTTCRPNACRPKST